VNIRQTGTILDKIATQKLVRLSLQKERVALERMIEKAKKAPEPRDFAAALKRNREISLIAEIKKASPSKGLLKESFDPADIARSYENSGASAISVITEEDFFSGSPDFLESARGATTLPILRKDFIFDSYQVYEAKVLGADAILLIVSLLEPEKLSELSAIAEEIGIAALVETHNKKEIEQAIQSGTSIIGINNRDLKTMTVDRKTAVRLANELPAEAVKIVESGIDSSEDMRMFEKIGYDAALVGESIITSKNVEEKIRSLMGKA